MTPLKKGIAFSSKERGIHIVRTKLAITVAKTIQTLSQALNKNGSHFPGRVARKIDPHILKKLAKNTKKIIFVSGTNGKSTTSYLIAHILKNNGYRILHNQEGSNMIPGITTTFIINERIFRKNEADIAVIEIDEGSIERVFKEITPHIMVFTNFFEDQLDRYGSIYSLTGKIKSILKNNKTKLFLNADDPFVNQLKYTSTDVRLYGLKKESSSFDGYSRNSDIECPICNQKLNYNYIHYEHLGYYECQCGFNRDNTFFEVEKVTNTSNGISVQTNFGNFTFPLYGLFNAINIAAAISVCVELGLNEEQIRNTLDSFKSKRGKLERFRHKGTQIILNMAKNAAGVNATITEYEYDKQEKQYLFVFNNNVNDGKDFSWIWDTEFERIDKEKTKKIICSGICAEETYNRILASGFPEEKLFVSNNINDAVKEMLKENINSYVVTNYSSLEKTRLSLVKYCED